MVRTLLVGPHSEQGVYTNPITGVLYLHAMLRLHGFEVDWIDENQGDPVITSGYDVVGVSMMTSNRKRALEICRQAKNDEALVVAGGPHPTLCFDQLLITYPFIDLCVHGDGEHALLEIVRGTPYPFIPNLAWRNVGTVAHTTRVPLNLDDLPFPSFDTVDFSRYKGGARIFFSRGCAYGKCMFCSVAAQWGRQRWRSPENMVREMLWLKELGQTGFALYDDCLTGNRELALQLFQSMIDNHVDDMWWCGTTRVGLVDRELVAMMKRAGCQEITFGVETAHPEAMKIYAKGQTIDQAERAIGWCKEVGLRCSVLMIYNGVRAREFDPVSKAWVARMGVGEGSANELQIFPGTPLFRAMKDHGFITDRFWVESDVPFPVYRGELDGMSVEEWKKYL